MIPNCKKLSNMTYEEMVNEWDEVDSNNRTLTEKQVARKYSNGDLVINCKWNGWITTDMVTNAGYRSMSIAFKDFLVPFKSDIDVFERPQIFWNIYNFDYNPSSDLTYVVQYLPQFRSTPENPGRVVVQRDNALSEYVNCAIGYMAVGKWK